MKRALFRAGLRTFNTVLHWGDCLCSRAFLRNPPVFIIGAPRSGSTLLYQVLTQRFDFAYLSNLHCLFYGAPSLIERFFPRQRPNSTTFQSRHGHVRGCLSPSECGEFWYRFFPRKPHYTPDLEEAKLRQIRKAVATLAHRKPVLFKNLYCSLRLKPLSKALPEAIFLVTHRNLVDNAHSILKMRRAITGDEREWFAMEPPGTEHLIGRPPIHQAVEQIRKMHAQIELDRPLVGAGKFLDVDYLELCRDPEAVCQQVNDLLGRRLRVKGPLPVAFEPSRTRADDPLHVEIVSYLKEFPD